MAWFPTLREFIRAYSHFILSRRAIIDTVLFSSFFASSSFGVFERNSSPNRIRSRPLSQQTPLLGFYDGDDKGVFCKGNLACLRIIECVHSARKQKMQIRKTRKGRRRFVRFSRLLISSKRERICVFVKKKFHSESEQNGNVLAEIEIFHITAEQDSNDWEQCAH